MDGLDRLSDIIDKLLKDISKYEMADGTKNAIKYFCNEKEKVIMDLTLKLTGKDAIINGLKNRLDEKNKVLKNYIEYFVDKEME